MQQTAQNQPIITTQDKLDDEHIQNIATQLKNDGHSITAEELKPDSQKPIPATIELRQAQAEIIGEDLSHLFTSTMEDITGGNSSMRTTKSSRFFGSLVEKLQKIKKPNQTVTIKD